ncbi:MAG: hypothetical protein ABIH18_09455 [Candidatus Omnitrophota bacterium]
MLNKQSKIIALILSFLLIFEQSGLAQVSGSTALTTRGQLDLSGYISGLRSTLTQDKYRPLHLRYLGYDAKSSDFKLLLDKGNFLLGEREYEGRGARDEGREEQRIKQEISKLLEYFFIGVSLPNESFWVNLRPDSPDNIIDDQLAKTDIGKILLEADVQLKKDTALYTSPQTVEGRKYWDKLYKKAEELYGYDNITIPTLTRPWIVPGEIIIRETRDEGRRTKDEGRETILSAYVYKAVLKVMLEEDYLSGDGGQGSGNRRQKIVGEGLASSHNQNTNKSYEFKDPRSKELNTYSTQLIKELIIPKLTKEINTSRRYAKLRQVYYSLILAQWFKNNVSLRGALAAKQSVNKITSPSARNDTTYTNLVNSCNLAGLTSKISWSKETYYKEYQKSFKDGEYSLKEPVRTPFGQTIKSYFSGGMNLFIPVSSSSVLAGKTEVVRNKNTVVTYIGGNSKLNIPFSNGLAVEFTPAEKVSSGINIIRLVKNAYWYFPIKIYERKLPDIGTIRDSLASFEYSDPAQDFSGVSTEHLLWAVKRMVTRSLPQDTLKQLCSRLRIGYMENQDRLYDLIFTELCRGRWSKKLVDFINADTFDYDELDFSIAVFNQNKDFRRQAVYEGIDNSLDAFGFEIGLFGFGIKQMAGWLNATGQDRIDVFSMQADSPASQLTILRAVNGQTYIQIRDTSLRAFQKAAGLNIKHGTAVRLSVKDKIPQSGAQLSDNQQVSLESIETGIHNCYPGIVSVDITTQIEGRQARKVNGFHQEEPIVCSKNSRAHLEGENKNRFIAVKLSARFITIVDNALGMGSQTICRMFVPGLGTKHPQILSGQSAIDSLESIEVVRKKDLLQRVCFSRSGKVIFSVDVPLNIIGNALPQGSLQVELGRLLDVPLSKDQIIIPASLKPGEVCNFELGMEYVLRRIAENTDLSVIKRIQYINAVIMGIEGLIQQKVINDFVINRIRGYARGILKQSITELKKQGYVILPYESGFKKIACPRDKKAIVFMNQGLFDWHGAASLEEIGAVRIPELTLGGDKQLPLVLIDFTQESLQGNISYDRDWYLRPEEDRLAVIKTDRFIALPLNPPRMKEFARLADKRVNARLTKEEQKLFSSWLQHIIIITSEEVVTSYEFAAPKENLRLQNRQAMPELIKGQIDSEAINDFFVEPPIMGLLRNSPKVSLRATEGSAAILFSDDKTRLLRRFAPRKDTKMVFRNSPIIDGAKRKSDDRVSRQPELVLSAVRPADAPNEFIITHTTQGDSICDANSENLSISLGGLLKIKRMNSDTFLVYDANDNVNVMRCYKDAGGSAGLKELPVKLKLKLGNIVFYNQRFIIIENNFPDNLPDNRYQMLLDVCNPQENYVISKKIYLSASGRFSVHQVTGGSLIYYDHSQRAPEPKEIRNFIPYSTWQILDNVDAVVIKNCANDGYDLFDLKKGNCIFTRFQSYVDVDSTGIIAIFMSAKGLGYVNLKSPGDTNPAISGGYANDIQVGCKDGIVSVITAIPAGPDGAEIKFIENFSRDNGEKFYRPKERLEDLDFQFKELIFPGFWEEYNLTHKRIWDRKKQQVVFRHSLGSRDRSSLLYGDYSCLFYEIMPPSGDKVKRAEIFYRDEKPYLFPGDVKKHQVRYLKGENVFYMADKQGDVVYVRGQKEVFIRGLVNDSKRFIIGQTADRQYLFNCHGKKLDITDQIPKHCLLTDVNGEYFVFSCMLYGDVFYLNPDAFDFSSQLQIETVDDTAEIEKQEKARELWPRIFNRRNDFIAQAQAVYRPFLELIPAEFKVPVEARIKAQIGQVYKQQETEIMRRYSQALESGNLDLNNLPFDLFSERMARFKDAFFRYIASHGIKGGLGDYAALNGFYGDLFTGLFALSSNPGLSLSAIDDNLFEALADSWNVDTQEQLDAVPLIGQLISGFKEVSQNRIKINELRIIVGFLSHAASKDPVNNIPVICNQLRQVLDKKEDVSSYFLEKIRIAFEGIQPQVLFDYLDSPGQPHNLGKARHVAVFLTQPGKMLEIRPKVVYEYEEIPLPQEGVCLSQAIKLEQQRSKLEQTGHVMTIEYFINHLDYLPEADETIEQEIQKYIDLQGEYHHQSAQNTQDALKKANMEGELVVNFFLQENEFQQEEYCEQMSDNGPGAEEEMALVVDKSTKREGNQMDEIGFFGKGKYTEFKGADRVEKINNNGKRAYMFIFTKDAVTGRFKLTGLRKITDKKLERGLTICRIKQIDNTIPQLDCMFSQEMWKDYCGLAQDEGFRIYFIADKGKKEPLIVEKEILAESDFIAVDPRTGKLTNFGKYRILSVKGSPSHIIDKGGYKIGPVPEEFIEFIPEPLRRHREELGIVFQIPLRQVFDRNGFEDQTHFLPYIKRYTAIDYYRVIAYKTLAQVDPQFVFQGFPGDWEREFKRDYWSVLLNDPMVVKLAEKINKGDNNISEKELRSLLTVSGKLDIHRKYVKLLLLTKAAVDKNNPGKKISLFIQRLAVQDALDKDKASAQAEKFKQAGLTIGDIPQPEDIPFFQKKVSFFQKSGIVIPEGEFIIHPDNYTQAEREFIESALSIARNFGLEQVYLVNDRVDFTGRFGIREKQKVMFLNRQMAETMGREELKAGGIDSSTDTVDHELAHLLEKDINYDDEDLLWEQGHTSHLINFTHEPVGVFAESMKQVAAVALFNNNFPQTDTIMAVSSAIEDNKDDLSPKIDNSSEVESVLMDFIRKKGLDKEVVFFEFLDGAHVDNGDYTWWKKNTGKFGSARNVFIDSFPVRFKNYEYNYPVVKGRELEYLLGEIIKNAYDGIVSYYIPAVCHAGPSEDYKGRIKLSVYIETIFASVKSLVIIIKDNGLGVKSAVNSQKKQNNIFRGKNNEGLECVKEMLCDPKINGEFELIKGDENQETTAVIRIPLEGLSLKKDIMASSSLQMGKLNKGGIDGSASSPLIPKIEKDIGGIDFRAMPIVNQPVISPRNNFRMIFNEIACLSGRQASSPLKSVSSRNDTNKLNNDSVEWLEIEKMVNAGIIPSSQRIKECLVSSCVRQDFAQNLDKVICCFGNILRLEEERLKPADSGMCEILSLLESDKPADELQAALSDVK